MIIPSIDQLNDFDFIYKNKDKIDWKYLYQNVDLTIQFKEEFKEYLNIYDFKNFETEDVDDLFSGLLKNYL